MASGNWILTVWRWFLDLVPTRGRTETPRSTSETSCESDVEKLRQAIENFGNVNLHNILSRQHRVGWTVWDLNIGQNDKAIKVADRFHQNFKTFKLSSDIADEIDTIKETFLKLKPTDRTWDPIKKLLDEARDNKDPECLIKAYTSHQLFTEHINKHSAVNTNHSLKLYCTLLNCPILARTQEYTEAFTKILFHPKLDGRLVRNLTVYRGAMLEDEKLVENYKNRNVALPFSGAASENKIKILCIYKINNTNRHTALDVATLTKFPDEEEVLILRFVPFKIVSVAQTIDRRTMTVCFDECKE